MDDGTLKRHKRRYGRRIYFQIIFATCGFTDQEQELLVQIFKNQVGIECYINSAGNGYKKIVVSMKDTETLLNYMGPCPVKCFEYKWRM